MKLRRKQKKQEVILYDPNYTGKSWDMETENSDLPKIPGSLPMAKDFHSFDSREELGCDESRYDLGDDSERDKYLDNRISVLSEDSSIGPIWRSRSDADEEKVTDDDEQDWYDENGSLDHVPDEVENSRSPDNDWDKDEIENSRENYKKWEAKSLLDTDESSITSPNSPLSPSNGRTPRLASQQQESTKAVAPTSLLSSKPPLSPAPNTLTHLPPALTRSSTKTTMVKGSKESSVFLAKSARSPTNKSSPSGSRSNSPSRSSSTSKTLATPSKDPSGKTAPVSKLNVRTSPANMTSKGGSDTASHSEKSATSVPHKSKFASFSKVRSLSRSKPRHETPFLPTETEDSVADDSTGLTNKTGTAAVALNKAIFGKVRSMSRSKQRSEKRSSDDASGESGPATDGKTGMMADHVTAGGENERSSVTPNKSIFTQFGKARSKSRSKSSCEQRSSDDPIIGEKVASDRPATNDNAKLGFDNVPPLATELESPSTGQPGTLPTASKSAGQETATASDKIHETSKDSDDGNVEVESVATPKFSDSSTIARAAVAVATATAVAAAASPKAEAVVPPRQKVTSFSKLRSLSRSKQRKETDSAPAVKSNDTESTASSRDVNGQDEVSTSTKETNESKKEKFSLLSRKKPVRDKVAAHSTKIYHSRKNNVNVEKNTNAKGDPSKESASQTGDEEVKQTGESFAKESPERKDRFSFVRTLSPRSLSRAISHKNAGASASTESTTADEIKDAALKDKERHHTRERESTTEKITNGSLRKLSFVPAIKEETDNSVKKTATTTATSDGSKENKLDATPSETKASPMAAEAQPEMAKELQDEVKAQTELAKKPNVPVEEAETRLETKDATKKSIKTAPASEVKSEKNHAHRSSNVDEVHLALQKSNLAPDIESSPTAKGVLEKKNDRLAESPRVKSPEKQEAKNVQGTKESADDIFSDLEHDEPTLFESVLNYHCSSVATCLGLSTCFEKGEDKDKTDETLYGTTVRTAPGGLELDNGMDIDQAVAAMRRTKRKQPMPIKAIKIEYDNLTETSSLTHSRDGASSVAAVINPVTSVDSNDSANKRRMKKLFKKLGRRAGSKRKSP